MKNGKQEIVLTEKKVKKDKKKKKIKKRVHKELGKIGKLDRINPYLHALADPFDVHGVKVPDFCLDDSCTFYSTLRQVLTVGANGCCGVIFGTGASGSFPSLSPFGGLVPYATGVAATYSTGLLLPTTCSVSALIPATPVNLQLSNFSAITNAIPNNFPRVRLVSFGVRIMYTGNALNRQGKITVAYAPYGTFTNKIANCSINLADVLLLPHSTVTSVPLVGAAMVTWRPTDFEDQVYCPVGPAAPNMPPTGPSPNGCAPCEIYVFVDGAVTNQTFFLEAVWNFEAIPTNNTLSFVTPSPSKADPISLAHAANRVSELPATRPLPEAADVAEPKTDSTLTHVESVNAPSMLDSVLSGGAKILGFAKGAYDTLSPLASSILSIL